MISKEQVEKQIRGIIEQNPSVTYQELEDILYSAIEEIRGGPQFELGENGSIDWKITADIAWGEDESMSFICTQNKDGKWLIPEAELKEDTSYICKFITSSENK